MKKKEKQNNKKKQLFENSKSKQGKVKKTNTNTIPLEESENSDRENIKKNTAQIKKKSSKEIKNKDNKLNNIKSKTLFGETYSKDLSKENNNKKEKKVFMSKRKKVFNSSSSSEGKIKKKKSENISLNLGNSGSESKSNEKKIINKATKKKKFISKKRNELDNKSNSSSSSNYHPEQNNFLKCLMELMPYMSSDSEIESPSKNKNINSEKSINDKIKVEKDDSKKKEENVKEHTKEKEIKDKNSKKKDKTKNKINDEKYNDKNREKEDKTEKKEEEDKIELNEQFNNTQNINSINYYAKKVEINKEDILPSYDFIELKNSDDILYWKGNIKIYDCKNKKEKLTIEYNFDNFKIKRLKDNYFIYVDEFNKYEIIIFHFEEFNTKMIIDQKMDLPEDLELSPNGPCIAPHLSCYPLNENFIIFKWSRNNNFYIYKNNSKEKNKFKFEEYVNIKLNKEAFVYINTGLEEILRINDNEFCIFAKSDQRPEPTFLFQAFMQGKKKHKEATYFAVYSFNSSKEQFELKKSKINYEKGVDYGFEIHLLKEKFIFYDGNMQRRTGKLVQVFNLETMQIIYIFKNKEIQFYNISDKKDIFFIRSNNLYEQYQINNNGFYKKIGEVRLQNLSIERKYKNGIIYKGNKAYYLFTH